MMILYIYTQLIYSYWSHSLKTEGMRVTLLPRERLREIQEELAGFCLRRSFLKTENTITASASMLLNRCINVYARRAPVATNSIPNCIYICMLVKLPWLPTVYRIVRENILYICMNVYSMQYRRIELENTNWKRNTQNEKELEKECLNPKPWRAGGRHVWTSLVPVRPPYPAPHIRHVDGL
jgi:hypothetical protein